jgi:ketosteroid isomerase-like protein
MHAMAHPNERILRDYFDAVAAGDLDRAAGALTADVVLHVPGRNAMSGAVHGPEAWQAYLRRMREVSGGSFRIEPHDVLVSDEHAVTLAALHAEVGGRTLDWHRVGVYHFRDGRISEVWLHEDDQQAVDEYV